MSTPEDPEAVWLRDVYQPSATNLTVRAVLVGVVIGAVMCLSNIYVFFKTGWSLGVTLTACILAYAAFQAAQAVGLVKQPLTVLENNALTTVASGAGYMTAGGNMAAFGALMMATTVRPNAIGMIAWFAVIAALGVFVAIPIKRQLINQEGLAFPTGTATAETMRSIHGATGSSSAGKLLVWSALFGAALTAVRDGWKLIPGQFSLPVSIAGHSLASWTIALKTEVVLLGAGALMSFRTGWSLLVGGLLTYGVLGPALLDRGLIHDVTYKGIVAWTLWPGAALLVGAGLTSFALDYKSLARAFRGLGGILAGKRAEETGIAAVEAPEWWFPVGLAVLTPLIVTLMALLFDIPVWAAVLAVPMAVLMGFVAARVTGETDVTPTKALGPVTQMVYGVITPGNMSGNIMSANVTGGIGLHAADLLTTMKTGWLLGAKPRHQVYAQLFGVLAGAAIIVPAFNLVIPDPSVLGASDAWPAPSCVVWAGVSKAFSGGLGALDPSSQHAILIGLALGIAMAVFEKLAPARIKAWVPSPYGIGLAMVVPASNSIMMFLGATIAEGIRRKAPQHEAAIVPVSSGLIAGESLAGIVIAMLTVGGLI